MLKLQQQPEVVAQRLAYLQRTSAKATDQDRTQCEVGGGRGGGVEVTKSNEGTGVDVRGGKARDTHQRMQRCT